MGDRGGIETMLGLLDEAFRGAGIEASDESQALTVTAVSSNTALIPNPIVTYASPSSTGTLAYTPAPNKFGTATITVTVSDGQGGTVARTFLVTVTPVADTPSITDAVTNEDTQSVAGLVIARNAADGGQRRIGRREDA